MDKWTDTQKILHSDGKIIFQFLQSESAKHSGHEKFMNSFVATHNMIFVTVTMRRFGISYRLSLQIPTSFGSCVDVVIEFQISHRMKLHFTFWVGNGGKNFHEILTPPSDCWDKNSGVYHKLECLSYHSSCL
jgi:hypothetical protein